MNCEKCQRSMHLVHEVVERETVFVLWDCGCGHKLLERRPMASASARSGQRVPSGLGALAAALAD